VRAAEIGGDAGVARVVGNRKDKKAFAIVDASKSYASIDVEAKAPLPAVTRTGKVERVLGHECEDWKIAGGEEFFDLCVAKGIQVPADYRAVPIGKQLKIASIP
jgi:hypothetical protein